jgi:hypothetical protein
VKDLKIETKVDFVNLGDVTMLKCPQCAFEYLHPISVSVHRGDDKTTVTSESVIVKEEKNEKRGVTITMEYACENGHHGNLIFQFYKGNIEVHHESLEPFKSNEDWNTIFRD